MYSDVFTAGWLTAAPAHFNFSRPGCRECLGRRHCKTCWSPVSRFAGLQPDIVLLMIGVNDITAGSTANKTAAALASMLTHDNTTRGWNVLDLAYPAGLFMTAPTTHVYLSQILPPGYLPTNANGESLELGRLACRCSLAHDTWRALTAFMFVCAFIRAVPLPIIHHSSFSPPRMGWRCTHRVCPI
jgi:hypothetical protein